MSTISDPHSIALKKAASVLGIEVIDHSQDWHTDAVEFKLGNHTEMVLDGRVYSHLGLQAATFADDKHISKVFLSRCGLKTPAHFIIDLDLPESIEEQANGNMMDGINYVCKPLYGTDGHAVGMNKIDHLDIDMHTEVYADTYRIWMVEEQITGKDLRIQVIGNKIAAACVREPAYVTGDGSSSLEELIEHRNDALAELNPNNKLELDADSRKLMREQNLYLDTVIEADRKIQLKYISNMGQGGVAIDITPDLHPHYHEIVEKVGKIFGFKTFALDGICADANVDPFENLYALEVNAKAQWMHHTFSEVRTHDIPQMILRDLFPELKD